MYYKILMLICLVMIGNVFSVIIEADVIFNPSDSSTNYTFSQNVSSVEDVDISNDTIYLTYNYSIEPDTGNALVNFSQSNSSAIRFYINNSEESNVSFIIFNITATWDVYVDDVLTEENTDGIFILLCNETPQYVEIYETPIVHSSSSSSSSAFETDEIKGINDTLTLVDIEEDEGCWGLLLILGFIVLGILLV